MSCIPMPQKWPVGWSDCLSILTILDACNASGEPSASHELRLFIICYPPNFAQNLSVTLSPCHLVTLSPCHPITPSPRHLVTLSPCHLVTPSPRHPVTPSPRYHNFASPWPPLQYSASRRREPRSRPAGSSA